MPYSSVTMSGTLIRNVRALYELGLRQQIAGNVLRYGINGYTDHAFSAYIIAVAAVESFVNETLMDQSAENRTCGSALWKLRRNWLERLELRDKMIILGQLLFGKSLDPSAQPLQDFNLLLKVRNECVHYKCGAPPKFMEEFIRRDIALTSRIRKLNPETRLSQPWASDLSCTEGIRWAHNTCCKVVQVIVASIPVSEEQYNVRGVSLIASLDDFKILHSRAVTLAGNYGDITEDQVHAYFHNLGLDPKSGTGDA
jgi:hypothetical protein